MARYTNDILKVTGAVGIPNYVIGSNTETFNVWGQDVRGVLVAFDNEFGLTCTGDPSGAVAGKYVGQKIVDNATANIYICKTPGTASTTVWKNVTAANMPFITAHDLGLHGDYDLATGGASAFTDDSLLLQTALDSYAATGGGYFTLRPEVAGKAFYFNGSLEIPSNCTVDFMNLPIALGPNFRMRARGDFAETPPVTSDSARINSSISSGATTIPLAIGHAGSVASSFVVGDYYVIRGENDSTGAALEKDIFKVTAINAGANTIDISPALTNDYDPTYPSSAWAAATGQVDRTTIYKVTTLALASDAAAGQPRVTVTTGGGASFALGNWVLLEDTELVSDAYAESSSNNLMRKDVAMVLGISGDVLTLDRNLNHTFQTSKGATVKLMNPAENVHIMNAMAFWHTDQGSQNYHTFELGYAVKSSIQNCKTKSTYIASRSPVQVGHKSQSFRLYISADCAIDGVEAANPKSSGSSEGYGATIYGSNNCQVLNSRFISCRHSVLFFQGSACNYVGNITSINALISDIDFHGALEVNNEVNGVICVSGNGQTTDSATTKTAIKFGNTTHLAGCHNNVVRNVAIYNFNNSTPVDFAYRAIEILAVSSGNLIENIAAYGCEQGLRMTAWSSTSTRKAQNNTLRNAFFQGCTSNVVYLDASNQTSNTSLYNIDGLIIDGLTSVGSSKEIRLRQCDNVVIKDYKVYNPNNTAGEFVIDANNAPGFEIIGGDFNGNEKGVKADTCGAFLVKDVVFRLTGTTVFDDRGGNNGYLWLDNDYPMTTPTFTSGGSGPSTRGEERHRREMFITHVAGYTADGTPLSTLIPVDDTLPAVTEGDEIATVNYTPKNPTGKLLVEVRCPFVAISTADNASVAIFDGSTCVGVECMRFSSGASSGSSMSAKAIIEFTSPSTKTISARAGGKTAGTTLTMGGKFTDVGHPYMIITELNR